MSLTQLSTLCFCRWVGINLSSLLSSSSECLEAMFFSSSPRVLWKFSSSECERESWVKMENAEIHGAAHIVFFLCYAIIYLYKNIKVSGKENLYSKSHFIIIIFLLLLLPARFKESSILSSHHLPPSFVSHFKVKSRHWKWSEKGWLTGFRWMRWRNLTWFIEFWRSITDTDCSIWTIWSFVSHSCRIFSPEVLKFGWELEREKKNRWKSL